MERGGKISKFQAVSEFFADNLDASAEDAVKAARKLGLDVTAAYARQIRSKAAVPPPTPGKRKKKKKKRVTRPTGPKRKLAAGPAKSVMKPEKAIGADPRSPADTDSVLEAVRFIRRVGGISPARQAIETAEAILSELEVAGAPKDPKLA